MLWHLSLFMETAVGSLLFSIQARVYNDGIIPSRVEKMWKFRLKYLSFSPKRIQIICVHLGQEWTLQMEWCCGTLKWWMFTMDCLTVIPLNLAYLFGSTYEDIHTFFHTRHIICYSDPQWWKSDITTLGLQAQQLSWEPQFSFPVWFLVF